MKDKVEFDISIWTIAKAVLVLAGFYLVFLIRDIIILFFFVLILVATFNPIVNQWERKIGRVPTVFALFLLLLGLITAVIYLIVPPVVAQFIQLSDQLPALASRFRELQEYIPSLERSLNTVADNLSAITGNVIGLTADIFGGVITLIMALVLTAYLLVDRENFARFAVSLFPSRQQERIIDMVNKIGQKLGGWFRGQLILMFIVGLIGYIGLLIIGVPFALVLAVVSGILEIVPTVGPILAGLIAAGIAFVDSPVKALFVVILYFIVQQLESAFIVPKVMQRAVGLSPVIIIFAFLVGGKLYGIIGAILAIPLAAAISVIASEWPTVKNTIQKTEKCIAE